jgi:plastocyanin
MNKVVLVLAGALFTVGCASQGEREAPAGADKGSAVSAAPVGRIRGVVRLQGPLPAAAAEPVKEHTEVCGHDVSLPRLALGEAKGVQDTFVYLDEVPAVQNFASKQPLLVDQKRCQYDPHMLIVPVGAKIEITNSDPILHNVHGSQLTEEGLQTIFNVAQPVRGQRTTVEPALTKPGIVVLACEAGHAWMNAYIFVANHPYVAITNHSGEFVMPAVPAGTYRIKMWHEGVTRKRNIEALQRYEYEEPYETTQDVVVQPGADAVVNFDLTLRPAN